MERMKEFILSPEEIYYIGKVSGGKYLDYDYIAAMKDIGKRGKIKQQEILDSLERKGYAQEDFLGNLEVDVYKRQLQNLEKKLQYTTFFMQILRENFTHCFW